MEIFTNYIFRCFKFFFELNSCAITKSTNNYNVNNYNKQAII